MNSSDYKSEGSVEFDIEQLATFEPAKVAQLFADKLRDAGLPLDINPAGDDLGECWGNRRWRRVRFGNAVDLVGADEFSLLKNGQGKAVFTWGKFGCSGQGMAVTEMDTVPPTLAEVALTLLREALAADPAAVQALIDNRVPCNEDLANHAHITVALLRSAPAEVCGIGCLGIVNGILKAVGSEKVIMAIVEDSGEISGFCLSSRLAKP